MAGIAANEQEAETWVTRIISWQRNRGIVPMIGANFGLSMDYDDFLVGFSGTVVAATVGLSRGNAILVREFGPVLVAILSTLRPGWWRLQLAVWLAHLGARFGEIEWFALGRDVIDAEGGIPRDSMEGPPGYAGEDGIECDDLYGGVRIACPDATTLRHWMAQKKASDEDLWNLCSGLLTDSQFEYSCGNEVTRVLWSGTARG